MFATSILQKQTKKKEAQKLQKSCSHFRRCKYAPGCESPCMYFSVSVKHQQCCFRTLLSHYLQTTPPKAQLCITNTEPTGNLIAHQHWNNLNHICKTTSLFTSVCCKHLQCTYHHIFQVPKQVSAFCPRRPILNLKALTNKPETHTGNRLHDFFLLGRQLFNNLVNLIF